MRLLLYGQSGSGKTTFWATFPGPIYAVICSGGQQPGELRSIDTPEYREKITAKVVRSSDRLKGHLEKVAAGGYGTFVLDHVSGLQDLVLKEILGLEELPAQKSWGMAQKQDYGQCTQQCKEFLRTMLNLPCHVVIIGQERTFGGSDDDGVGSDVIAPAVGASVFPKLAEWLNPACDYVLQMFKRSKTIQIEKVVNGKKRIFTRKSGEIEHCIRCEEHEVYMTKFRKPGGVSTKVLVNPTYESLTDVLAE
jgi:hypothetical protein